MPRRRQTGMRKRCLKRQDIHRALTEKGFCISYSSVCKFIRRCKAEKTKKPKDVFVKQYYEPGEECEFDWGEVNCASAASQSPSRWRSLPCVTARDAGPTCSATRIIWLSWSRSATSSTVAAYDGV